MSSPEPVDLETEMLRTRREFTAGVDAVRTADDVAGLRVRFTGKKAGALTGLFRLLGQVSAPDRPRVGALLNELKAEIESRLDEISGRLSASTRASALERERADVTLPGRRPARGSLHPTTLARLRIEQIFREMGYSIATGPEVEDDFHNFEALNLPQDHPARDAHDTFYLDGGLLLRTHTSPVQIRTMRAAAGRVPVKIIVPGRVFRRDVPDASHSPVFHQVEGLAVDRAITMGDLKGTLELFAREMFGPKSRIRFRPSFFPFTEPSAEVDVLCFMCGGNGCRACGDGWLEILGSGMVHPTVLRNGGYDPEEVTGWAFGMGIERIAMLKYGVDDLRLFFENDLRFLKQFGAGR